MRAVIDAGHNDSKFDTGAVGNGYKEQDINFEIGSRVACLLWQKGYDVKETRPNKTDILGVSVNDSINTRGEIAKEFNADIFVSIHCNSFGSNLANGAEVIVYEKTGKSFDLANHIQNQLVSDLGLTNRGVIAMNIGVVRMLPQMARCIVEVGFIGNDKDIKVITQYDRVAKSIFDGILKYMEQIVKVDNKVITIPKTVYKKIGSTYVVEIDPRNIFGVETQRKTNQTPYDNFVNSIFFQPQANGIMYPNGIMVNAGQIIANNPTHKLPVSTLIIRGANDVEVKQVMDITREQNVWFAVSGYGIYPKITAKDEGFTGKFADVLRCTNRPIIGYRKSDNKIVIAVRPLTTDVRASETAKNLGLDCAISLDGGGSTTLKIDGKYLFKGDGRKLFGGIIWN